MRLNSKSIALVALILLTATPRVFDQLAYLKDSAAERFRTELRGIFRGFTTPETEQDDARQQYSELLARAAANTPACDSSNELRTTRAAFATRTGGARLTTHASELGHRETFVIEDTSQGHLIADAATAQSEQLSEADNTASLNRQGDVLLVARNFSDYPLFDEAYGPIAIDSAAVVAQLEWRQEDDEAPAPPDAALPAAFPKRPAPRAERLTRKFVMTNFQIRLPENLDTTLNNVIINSDALIKARDHFAPAKPKCRTRVVPTAPDALRPLEKPAIIS